MLLTPAVGDRRGGVDAEDVEDGRLEVGRGNGAVRDERRMLVAGAEDGPATDAAARREHGIGVRPVVAACRSSPRSSRPGRPEASGRTRPSPRPASGRAGRGRRSSSKADRPVERRQEPVPSVGKLSLWVSQNGDFTSLPSLCQLTWTSFVASLDQPAGEQKPLPERMRTVAVAEGRGLVVEPERPADLRRVIMA